MLGRERGRLEEGLGVFWVGVRRRRRRRSVRVAEKVRGTLYRERALYILSSFFPSFLYDFSPAVVGNSRSAFY